MSKRWADYSDEEDDIPNMFLLKFLSMIRTDTTLSKETESIIKNILNVDIGDNEKEVRIRKLVDSIIDSREKKNLVDMIDKISES